ncbi:transposase [Anaerolineales bacterium HSG25]|nr:transposase [Anaerolineales bacterium HSG25]
MFPIVEIPEIVTHYSSYYEGVFSEQALLQFERYISGLIVSENKTVEGLNRFIVNPKRNQSSLNRLLNRSPFSLEALNKSRLQMLQSQPQTQYKAKKGVVSIDDTLLSHTSPGFEDIAYLYDHVQEGYTWAHNLVNVHYSDDQTDYPLMFELWKPVDLEQLELGLRELEIPLKASKEPLKQSAPKKWRNYLLGVWRRQAKKDKRVAQLYDTKLAIAQRLLENWCRIHPNLRLPITFDHWYTKPAFCRFIDKQLQRFYVGTLAGSDTVRLKTGVATLDQFAQRLKLEHGQALKTGNPPIFRKISFFFKGEKEIYYSYYRTHHIPRFGRQRLVINFRQPDLSDTPTFFISNQLKWHAKGITRIRRHRWPVEVYHEEGKVEGLDQYQVRNIQAISKHIAFVAIAYSILKLAQYDRSLHLKLQSQLKKTMLDGSAPQWRRNTQAQLLWSLGTFIAQGIDQGQTLADILTPLTAIYDF